jgi:gamma-glutamylcyclotransferase (GGCT)/AIG2-like uncharacterized protein YtfP
MSEHSTGDAILLFVYGTLMSGGGMEGRLRAGRRLRPAHVRGTLYDLGSYPALTLEGEGEVLGEIWSAPRETLLDLDAYEGVEAGLFTREVLDVDGDACFVYTAGPRLQRLLTPGRVVASGRWR